MAAQHRYRTELAWTGSTSEGYRAYSREHRVTVSNETLTVSADGAYLGDSALPNPENLLLAAASSCQLLSFLALAARDGLDVRAYTDHADALMPATREHMRITQIVLRPKIVLGPGVPRDQVDALIRRAHEECFIANTINAEIVVDATIEILGL